MYRMRGPGVFWGGLAMLVLGLVITVGSLVLAEVNGGGFYFVSIGLIVAGIINMVRGAPYLIGAKKAQAPTGSTMMRPPQSTQQPGEYYAGQQQSGYPLTGPAGLSRAAAAGLRHAATARPARRVSRHVSERIRPAAARRLLRRATAVPGGRGLRRLRRLRCGGPAQHAESRPARLSRSARRRVRSATTARLERARLLELRQRRRRRRAGLLALRRPTEDAHAARPELSLPPHSL